jgi:hypothetical protein
MDWIPALFKQLGLSRSVVGAVFITSVVLFIGPRIAPGMIDSVPKPWGAVVVAAMVFSGSLLLFWGAGSVWIRAVNRWDRTSKMLASIDLSQLEVDLLHVMGDRPSEALNLEAVNYEGLGLSRLEVLELVHGLERKGLLRFNQFSSELVWLTATGRERALEIQRATKARAT